MLRQEENKVEQEGHPGQKRAVFEQGKIAQHFARRKLSKNEKIEILQKRERSWQNGNKEKSIGIFSRWL